MKTYPICLSPATELPTGWVECSGDCEFRARPEAWEAFPRCSGEVQELAAEMKACVDLAGNGDVIALRASGETVLGWASRLAATSVPGEVPASVYVVTEGDVYAVLSYEPNSDEPGPFYERSWHELPVRGTPEKKRKPIEVREACRRRLPLDGADAQALEHAITIAEEERDALREQLAEADGVVYLVQRSEHSGRVFFSRPDAETEVDLMHENYPGEWAIRKEPIRGAPEKRECDTAETDSHGPCLDSDHPPPWCDLVSRRDAALAEAAKAKQDLEEALSAIDSLSQTCGEYQEDVKQLKSNLFTLRAPVVAELEERIKGLPRYDLWAPRNSECVHDSRSDDGDWVKYEDIDDLFDAPADKLLAERETLREQTAKQRDRLVACYDALGETGEYDDLPKRIKCIMDQRDEAEARAKMLDQTTVGIQRRKVEQLIAERDGLAEHMRELEDALKGNINALDNLMGDSDVEGDDSLEFQAMQKAVGVLDAGEKSCGTCSYWSGGEIRKGRCTQGSHTSPGPKSICEDYKPQNKETCPRFGITLHEAWYTGRCEMCIKAVNCGTQSRPGASPDTLKQARDILNRAAAEHGDQYVGHVGAAVRLLITWAEGRDK